MHVAGWEWTAANVAATRRFAIARGIALVVLHIFLMILASFGEWGKMVRGPN
jgi:hypothetical protein